MPGPTSSRAAARAVGVLVALAVLGAGGWAWWRAGRAEDARADARRARRLAERGERLERRRARLTEESRRLMPRLLDGVALGQSVAEVRRARPRAHRTRQGAEPGLLVFEERFPNGARGVYFFHRASGRLERVQVLSLLPNVAAIAPHLAAMNDRYGRPTGYWDCPMTGNVPPRRFTWRGGRATVSDVFLVHPGGVPVTLYVTSNEETLRSLRRSRCRPVAPEDADRFPVARPEQLEDEGRAAPGRPR